ncbi:MAG: hypothetical protein HC892_08860 [Saprospiraceae bacterium]|nr:hypothetical protein [Saprospiraceae bacterium]
MNLIKVVLLLLLGLSLFNCKFDPKPSATETDFKRTSNEVIASHIGEPDNLNPLVTTNAYSNYLLQNVFMQLQDIDPTTLTFIPILVKSRPTITQTIEEGKAIATQYAFELRNEAVWDNGSPVTAYDYVFTLKAALNPKVGATSLSSLLESIKNIEIDSLNPKRFTVTVEGTYILNEEIVSASFLVMPEYHYDPNGLLKDIDVNELLDPEKAEAMANSNPKLQQFADEFLQPFFAREQGGVVGCGPYRFREWVTGQKIVLEKKDNWWGKVLENEDEAFEARVDAIIYQPVADHTAASTLLKDEQIDVRAEIAPPAYNLLKNDSIVNKIYNLRAPIQYTYYFWYINTKRPKLNDKRVRRALAHVINVEQIIETVYDGALTRIAGPILPSMLGYNEQLKPVPFDIARAKALLQEAGWTDTNSDGTVDKIINGKREEMVLELLTVAGIETQQQAALLMQQDALKAGIKFEIIARDQKAGAEDQSNRNFDLANRGTAIPTPNLYDPKQSWHTESDNPAGFNRSGFGNAATDALIEEIRTTLDEQKRAALISQLQEIIYDEQPLIFLWTAPQFLAIHRRFEAETYSLRPGYFPGSF